MTTAIKQQGASDVAPRQRNASRKAETSRSAGHDADAGERAEKGEIGVSVGDRMLAILMLVLLSPVLLLLTILVALVIGRPAFYKGHRLGRGKRPFNVYKFRTLPTGIQKRLGAVLFSEQEEALPVLARFLRDTRLDELPQLINIARGEMQFFGPRPERPEIYERVGAQNPDYEIRFLSAPGLFGISQLITPHSAPKELRARLDRRFIKAGTRPGLGFIGVTMLALIRRLGAGVVRYFWETTVRLRLFKGEREKRHQARVAPPSSWLEFVDPTTNQPLSKGVIVDMNRNFLRARFDTPLPWSFVTTHRTRMAVLTGTRHGGRIKTARSRAEIERGLSQAAADGSVEYLIAYEAETPFNRYLIDQYFLHQSILPRR